MSETASNSESSKIRNPNDAPPFHLWGPPFRKPVRASLTRAIIIFSLSLFRLVPPSRVRFSVTKKDGLEPAFD